MRLKFEIVFVDPKTCICSVWTCIVDIWTCILGVWTCFGMSGLVLYKLFLSVGSPLRGNPFSEFWLCWTVLSVCGVSPSGESIFRILTFLNSDFYLRALPFGGIHFQNPDFCLGNLVVIGAGGTCCPRLGEPPGATTSHCPLRHWVRTLLGQA